MELVRTKEILLDLQHLLDCSNCKVENKELSSLGNCEHRFCRKCVTSHAGYPCPTCGVPSNAKNSSVDKQLSNVAALCSLMLDIIDGNDLFPFSDETKSEKKNPTVYGNTQPTRSRKRRNLETVYTESNITQGNKGTDVFVKIKEVNKKIESIAGNFVELMEMETPKVPRKSGLSSRLSQPNGKTGILNLGNNEESREKLQIPKPVQNNILKASDVATPQSVKKKRASIGSANLEKRNGKGETLLQVATIKKNTDEVKRLLNAGANPNVKDNAGWTPLHEAVGEGCTEIAKLLIYSGASVNAPGLDNETPLHDAVMNQHIDCVQLLTSHGASVFARNSHGLTPLDIAQNDVKDILLTVSQSMDIGDHFPLLDESNKPLCFTTSSLSKEQSKLLNCYCKEIQAKLVSDITPEVTHLITAANENKTCSRTFKYLHALVAGKWIVDFKWLESCMVNKCRVQEQEYQIVGSTAHPMSNAPEKSRMNRLKQLPPLFDGCQFFFYGKPESGGLTKEQLTVLVKQGGGSILTREPHIHNLDDYAYTHPYHAQNTSLRDCTIYKIYDDNHVISTPIRSQRMSSLPTSWLIDSINMFSILDKNNVV